MNTSKVLQATNKNKQHILSTEYDHNVALDWSQEVMAIAHMSQKSREPVVFERDADIKMFILYLKSLRGSIVLTFEETTTAQWLYCELRDVVDRIVICNPFHNRLLVHGPKTDKIDASKLCSLLRAGLLKEVFHSTDDLYELRLLVSAYDDLVKSGVRVLNQMSALKRGHSDTTTNGPFIIEYLNKTIDLYRTNKEQFEHKFTRLCRRLPQLRLLLKVHGIGEIFAVKILAAVVNAERFKKSANYMSYCGLVKHEKISGRRSYGRRKPKYNHLLKAVYKSAALAAIGGRNPIREYYDSLLEQGVAEYNARHAVARYIARITYGILKTNTPYEPYRWRHSDTTRDVA